MSVVVDQVESMEKKISDLSTEPKVDEEINDKIAECEEPPASTMITSF